MEKILPRNFRKHVDKENDKVFADIEKFMHECQNMSRLTPNPHIRRIYDSDSELLKVLDSNDKKKDKVRNKTMSSVPPKKRKLSVPEELKKKVPKTIKSPVKKKEENSTGRVRAKKLNKAEVKEISEIKFATCKPFQSPKKRKIKKSFWPSMHKAVVTIIHTKPPPKIWNTVKIKKEVVDLTGDEEIMCTILKFAKISHIEQGEAIDLEIVAAVASIESDCLCQASVSVPKIEYHTQDSCVDLTESEDLAPLSEKECACNIVHIIYNYHKIYEANRKVEYALQEIEECLAPEDVNHDYEVTFSLLAKHTDAMGYALIATLSKMFVKNLNLIRFLDILASKLQLMYHVTVVPKVVCFYLFSMLNQEGGCKNHLCLELMNQIQCYIKNQSIKEERGESENPEEMFTQEQLSELFCQIQTYNELAIRQEQLMAVYNEQLEELGLPVTKQIKQELLSARGEVSPLHPKIDDRVYILDD